MRQCERRGWAFSSIPQSFSKPRRAWLRLLRLGGSCLESPAVGRCGALKLLNPEAGQQSENTVSAKLPKKPPRLSSPPRCFPVNSLPRLVGCCLVAAMLAVPGFSWCVKVAGSVPWSGKIQDAGGFWLLWLASWSCTVGHVRDT